MLPPEFGVPITSVSLLESLRAPRPPWSAWDRFDYLYRPVIRGWLRRAGAQDADADDLTQQVFLKLYGGALGRYARLSGSPFHGWLRTVVTHVYHDFCRRGLLPSADGLSGVAEESPMSDLEEAEYRGTIVKRALELIRPDFAPRTWDAFARTMVDDHSISEIAQELNVTSAAVHAARFRVLSRLRREIADLLE